MTGNKEMAGVGLAFVGFVIIVMGFKGTWSKVWHDLFGGSGGAVDANTATFVPGPSPSFGPSTPQNPGGLQIVPIPAGPGINPRGPFQGSSPAPAPATSTIGLRLPNTFIQTPSGVLT